MKDLSLEGFTELSELPAGKLRLKYPGTSFDLVFSNASAMINNDQTIGAVLLDVHDVEPIHHALGSIGPLGRVSYSEDCARDRASHYDFMKAKGMDIVSLDSPPVSLFVSIGKYVKISLDERPEYQIELLTIPAFGEHRGSDYGNNAIAYLYQFPYPSGKDSNYHFVPRSFMDPKKVLLNHEYLTQRTSMIQRTINDPQRLELVTLNLIQIVQNFPTRYCEIALDDSRLL